MGVDPIQNAGEIKPQTFPIWQVNSAGPCLCGRWWPSRSLGTCLGVSDLGHSTGVTLNDRNGFEMARMP